MRDQTFYCPTPLLVLIEVLYIIKDSKIDFIKCGCFKHIWLSQFTLLKISDTGII